MKISGTWCQENDKSSPSSHLPLPPAASIFSSTHYVALSHSARAFLPCLAFSFLPFLTLLLPFFQLPFPSMSFPCLVLISVALIPPAIFVPLLPLLSPLPPRFILRLPSRLPPHLLILPTPILKHNLPLSYSCFFDSLHHRAFPLSPLAFLLPGVL